MARAGDAGLFVAAAGLHTGRSPPTRLASRLDNADTALNTWIVAWVAHQLPRGPLELFDAPMFHPNRTRSPTRNT